jgi:hypothetical protein
LSRSQQADNAFIRHSTSGWSHLAQTVCVQPGRRYRFTAWVRSSEAHREGAIGLRAVGGPVLQERGFGRLNAYTPLTLDFTPDARTSQVQVFVGMNVRNNKDTWIQVDDVSFAPA